MSGASRVSLATALARGQTACPKCAGGTAKANPGGVVDINPSDTADIPTVSCM